MTRACPGAGPARQQSLRSRNLALVLQLIAEAPDPVSRADVSAATGLTRATVSALVDAMVAGGLVGEVEPRHGRQAGRPATGLVLSGDGPSGLGLEINVDYVAACVVDLAGGVRYRAIQQEDQRGRTPQEVLGSAAAIARTAIKATRRLGLIVAGAGVGVPGMVDAGTGWLRLAPNLGWRDIDVRAALADHRALTGLPVAVDNEANFAAIGEWHAARPGPGLPADFLHISGEIGVGAGIILQGRLFRGTRGWAGELGHLTLNPEGGLCCCGSRGCLELVAGQEAILTAAGLPAEAATAMGGQPTVSRIVAAAERGDGRTLAALSRAGRALGQVSAAVVNLFDIGCVVLGGIYGPLGPWIQPEVEQELAGHALRAAWSPVTVRVSSTGTEAAVRGAAVSVTDALLRDPAAWLARSASP